MGHALRIAAAVLGVALTGTAVVAAAAVAPPGLLGPSCEVVVRGETRTFSVEQAQSLTTLAGVAQRDDVDQERLAAAVTATLQDDLDTAAPDAAAAALTAVPAGATPTPEDLSLARALLGFGTDRLACDPRNPAVALEQEGPSGLTPRAERFRDDVLEVFGRQALGGYAPGGVSTGHIPGSAHYEGRAVDVFYRPVTEENLRRGWATAQWTVAHADRLGVATVIFDRQVWSLRRGGDGWREYRHPSGTVGNPILDHLDHVHVDVLRGRG